MLKTGFIEHKSLLVAGIGEAYLAELIKDFEEALPEHIKLAYLPNFGMVRLRLTGFGSDKTVLQEEVNGLFQSLKEKVKEFLVTDEDIPLELVLGRLLNKKGKTMTTTESCTVG